MDLKERTLFGVKWTGLTSLFTFILGLVQISIIARYLPESDIGILSLVTVVVGFVRLFSDIGITNSVIHFQDLTHRQLNTLYWINIIGGILFACLLYGLAPLVSNYYQVPELTSLLRLASLALIFGAIGQQYYIQFKRDLQFNVISKVDMTQRLIIFSSTIILLVVYQMGLYSVVYGLLIGTLFYGLYYLWIGSRTYFIPKISTINISECSDCLRFGMFQVGYQSVSYVSGKLDVLIIGRVFGMEVLGFYELALILISRPITIINPIFNTVSFPIFSKMQQNLKRINTWFIKQVAIVSLILMPIFFGMYAVKEELVLFLFGEEKYLAVVPLGIIWMLGLFRSISNPIGPYVLALGKPNYIFYFSIFQIIVHATLLGVGIYFFDYVTTLILFTAGSILITIPAEYYLRYRLSKMSVWEHFKVVIHHFLLAGIMCLIVIFIKPVVSSISDHLVFNLGILIVFGGIVYAILQLLFNKTLLLSLKEIILSNQSENTSSI